MPRSFCYEPPADFDLRESLNQRLHNLAPCIKLKCYPSCGEKERSHFFLQGALRIGHPPDQMEPLTDNEIRQLVQAALAEDIGPGDVTTDATVPEDAVALGYIVAREPLILAGIALAETAFRTLSPEIRLERKAADGSAIAARQTILEVSGSARAILTAERVALNFLQRLSGVATLTSKFVEAVRGTRATILDTRKTTPGWRRLEKYAVACGGGRNHRMGLFDLVLIKDNHLEALRQAPPHPIGAAVRRARERRPNLQIEVEADTLEQVQQAVESGADIILLDNMTIDELKTAVHRINRSAKTEASGGVNLSNVRAIAETGVDYISIGALTHSAPCVDIALDLQQRSFGASIG